jgi:hypothetical protein
VETLLLFLFPTENFYGHGGVGGAKIDQGLRRLYLQYRLPLALLGCSHRHALPACYFIVHTVGNGSYDSAFGVERDQGGQAQFRTFFYNELHFGLFWPGLA